jgi:hypothetical protein
MTTDAPEITVNRDDRLDAAYEAARKRMEPRQIVITVPMAPPAELSPNRRGSEHWRYRQRAAKELREAAWSGAVYLKRDHEFTFVEPFGGWRIVSIHEHLIWPKGRRLVDPDSITGCCKAALDGIVDAGIIAGDSAQHIAQITASQEKGTDKQGSIVITISEAEK